MSPVIAFGRPVKHNDEARRSDRKIYDYTMLGSRDHAYKFQLFL